TKARWTVRDLPFAARLTLAAFLVSVGVGYFSALVQLHFQHARPGELMPTTEDAVKKFHPSTTETPTSRIQRLLDADENLPFNGTGQMAAAFTHKSPGWEGKVNKAAKALAKKAKLDDPNADHFNQAQADLRKPRDAE